MSKRDKQYILFGINHEFKFTASDCDSDIKEPVATFSSRKKAEEYVKKAELKSARGSFSFKINTSYGFRFKAKSVLRYYVDYEIEEHMPEELPHDPEI